MQAKHLSKVLTGLVVIGCSSEDSGAVSDPDLPSAIHDPTRDDQEADPGPYSTVEGSDPSGGATAGSPAGVPEDAGPIETPEGVLCASCDKSPDCPGAENACLVNDNTGEKFCSRSCDEVACPAGFRCLQIPGDISAKQCIPPGETCQQQPVSEPETPSGDGVLEVLSNPVDEAGEPASAIKVTEVALYQAVKIPLMLNGEAVGDLNAPLVVARPGLLRVFVQPEDAFADRDLVAKLTLNGRERYVSAAIDGPSEDGDIGSTFNFLLAAPDITANLELSVAIHEVIDGPSDPGNVAPGVRWPTSGTQAFDAIDTRGGFEVTFVPVSAGGSTGTAEQARLQEFVDYMWNMYPVAEIPFRVAEPYELQQAGWTSAIAELADLRQRDGAAPNDYYYGLIPGSGPGIQGISYTVRNPNQLHPRASAGKDGTTATDTFPHEIGHAMGLPHAPCGTAGESSYPYTGAGIGIWGYHIPEEVLLGPATFVDMMSYCDPVWISDYNYRRLAERIMDMKMLTENSDIGYDWKAGTFERLNVSGEVARVANRAWRFGTVGAHEVNVRIEYSGSNPRDVPGYLFEMSGGELRGTLLLPSGSTDGATEIRIEGGTSLPLRR